MGRVKGPGGTTAVTRCWVQLTYIAGYYVFTGILRYWVPSIISDTLDMPTPAAFTVRGKGTSRGMEGAGGGRGYPGRCSTFHISCAASVHPSQDPCPVYVSVFAIVVTPTVTPKAMAMANGNGKAIAMAIARPAAALR